MTITWIREEQYKDYRGAFSPEIKKAADLLFGALDDEGEAAGGVAVRIDENRLLILSLYVVPQLRRQGIGRELMNQLEEFAYGMGFAGITIYFPEEADGSLEAFLKAQGFAPDEEASLMEISLEELMGNKATTSDDTSVRSLEEVTDADYIRFLKGIDASREEEEAKLPMEQEAYDTDISFLHFDEEGEPVAGVFTKETDAGYETAAYVTENRKMNSLKLLYQTLIHVLSEENPKARIFAYAAGREEGKEMRGLMGRALISRKRILTYTELL